VIESLAFSADGRRLVTGSRDQTARVWDTATGRELLALKDHPGLVTSVAFSLDGGMIATVSEGMVRIWKAAAPSDLLTWEAEESARERLAVLERERGNAREWREWSLLSEQNDPGLLGKWLLLGPIELPYGLSGEAALDQELIPRESELQPRTGDRRQFGDRELTWQPVERERPVLDFNTLLETTSNRGVAYAVCYIHSDRPRRGLRVRVLRSPQAKVYLDGRLVFKDVRGGFGSNAVGIAVNLSLEAGLNTLVFKTVNDRAPAWQTSVRFTDAAGNPVDGISVTLDPSAQNAP